MVCPLYPVHLVIMYSAALLFVWMAGLGSMVGAAAQSVNLKLRLHLNGTELDVIDVKEGNTEEFTFYLDDLPAGANSELFIEALDPDGLDHIDVNPKQFHVSRFDPVDKLADKSFSGQFNVTGKFLGFTKIKFILSDGSADEDMKIKLEDETPNVIVDVKVQRGTRLLDKIFLHVVIIMVMIAYINMGCTVDLTVICHTFRRPVAPAIGLVCQYLFMPVCSFTIGYLLFSDCPSMWLGLFLTGCCPGGGGSNMWTYLLGGSLDLSVTMTFISTLAAFGLMPLWVYALARSIYKDGYFSEMPYKNMAMVLVGLIIPLAIGIVVKLFLPRVADFLKRMLKPVSLAFIVFVMTFGIYAHLYIFSYLDWKVALAGMCLPWLGFLFGGISALVCRQDMAQAIAISIETGVQNTGLAIGIVKIALSPFSPLGDLTMVMPIAIATMTPLPLTLAYVMKRIIECRQRNSVKKYDSEVMADDGANGKLTIVEVERFA